MPLDHKQLILTAIVNKPATDCAFISDWLKRIVKSVKMNIKIGPCVEYVNVPGNEGITSIVCIETSHIAFHCWDKITPPHIKFDLYSCATFDVETVIPFIMEFDPYYYKWILIDRNNSIQIVEKGGKQCKPIIDLLDQDSKSHITKKDGSDEYNKARVKYSILRKLYSLKGSEYEIKSILDHSKSISGAKWRAKKRNLDFDLTKEWYEKALKEAVKKYPKILVHPTKDRRLDFWVASIDRIDPKKGYTQSNCRIVPNAINFAKNKWTSSELKDLYTLLKED